MCLVCSQLEGEMFLRTNQPCFAATGGRANLRRQSDSVLRQNRQTGPTKTMLALRSAILHDWWRCSTDPVVLRLVFFSLGILDIFAFVESLFRRKFVLHNSPVLRKQVVIFLNTVTSIHVSS